MPLLLVAVVGYLLGSIPFGLLLTRWAGLGDVRSIGSGNIGATNVLRTGRKGLAAATLLLDALKGTAAVLFGFWFTGLEGALIGGLAAFVGHILPVWLGFKGGKGIATYIGVLLGLAIVVSYGWALLAVFAAVWLAMAFAFRYSSLAALTAVVAVPIVAYIIGPPQTALAIALMSLIAIFKHRPNIRRLVRGEEPRIGSKG